MKLGQESKYDVAWCRKQAERFAHVDSTPRRGMDGREYERTLALACPVCGAVFFTYQPCDTPYPPYTDPGGSEKPPQTCGDPRCYREADRRWFATNQEYQEQRTKYFDDLAGRSAKKAPPVLQPKLVKLGE